MLNSKNVYVEWPMSGYKPNFKPVPYCLIIDTKILLNTCNRASFITYKPYYFSFEFFIVTFSIILHLLPPTAILYPNSTVSGKSGMGQNPTKPLDSLEKHSTGYRFFCKKLSYMQVLFFRQELMKL
jgi:hypothetical protein